MTDKPGRNDPCPCGSGKKYKQCCLLNKGGKKKLTAKWLNAPKAPNLLERTFGEAVKMEPEESFKPVKKFTVQKDPEIKKGS